jgi:hypothetical protein
MASLLLSAKPRQSTVMVGASLLVDATLTSGETGGRLVLVQAEGDDSRFEFELASKEHGVFAASAATLAAHVIQHGGPQRMPMQRPLRPGESATYTDDAATYFLSPPPAGDYTLTVRWNDYDGQSVSAAPVPVRIDPVRPTLAAGAVDLSGIALTTAFVHGTDLFTRSSEGGDPAIGRAAARHSARSPITGLALASDVDQALAYRWVAWLEGGALSAGALWGDSFDAIAPAPHGLEDAALLEYGWQLADGAAMFAVMGTKGGRGHVDFVRAPRGAPFHHELVDLGAGASHTRWTTAALWRHAPGTVEIVRAGAPNVLELQRVDLAQRAAGAAQPIAHLPGPVLAMAVTPVLGPTPVADVLCDEAPALTYLRVPLAAPGGPRSWTLAPPPGAPTAAHPPSYGLARVPHPSAPVLAQVGDALYLACAAGAGTWSRVEESKHGVAHVRLEHLAVPDGSGAPGRVVATWFDGLYGFTVRDVTALVET